MDGHRILSEIAQMSVFDGVKALQKQVKDQRRAPLRGWHGHNVRGNVSPTYRSWLKMRERCTNPNAYNFTNYGGRGIRVCRRWDSFALFLADMGDRPAGMSLDRIDVNKGYDKMNCKWSDKKEQRNNRRDS